jgi:cytochrome bd-type quinol oxidase subunit 1
MWVKIFALSFALGVVSGITMSFQFGTNWPGYMNKAGNIAGPLLGYEVLTAFFLEATFLGVMLFGRDRVPAWLHTAVCDCGRDRDDRVRVLDPRAQLVDAGRPRATP